MTRREPVTTISYWPRRSHPEARLLKSGAVVVSVGFEADLRLFFDDEHHARQFLTVALVSLNNAKSPKEDV